MNGGLNSLDKVKKVIKNKTEHNSSFPIEGVMSGRLATENPWEIARVDSEIYKDVGALTETREEIIRVSQNIVLMFFSCMLTLFNQNKMLK